MLQGIPLKYIWWQVLWKTERDKGIESVGIRAILYGEVLSPLRADSIWTETSANFWYILKVEPTECAGGWRMEGQGKQKSKGWIQGLKPVEWRCHWQIREVCGRNRVTVGRDGELGTWFQFGIVYCWDVHWASKSRCAMAYTNLIFSETLGLAVYISMAIIFRRLEEIAQGVEAKGKRRDTKIKSSGPPMMPSKFKGRHRANNEISPPSH